MFETNMMTEDRKKWEKLGRKTSEGKKSRVKRDKKERPTTQKCHCQEPEEGCEHLWAFRLLCHHHQTRDRTEQNVPSCSN